MLKYRNSILLSLFAIGFVQFTFFSPTFQGTSILAVVGLIYGYLEYKNSDAKVKQLNSRLDAQELLLKDLTDKVTTIKIVQQTKPGSLQFRT